LPKLINILAASIGSGIVLGAGIRLGEAITAQYSAPGSDAGRKLAEKLEEKLGTLENRLLNLEEESPAELRVKLRDWLDESVTTRMADVEARLRAESERGRKQTLDAFAESVQTRVIHRISKLEEEVAGQSAAMNELRDCSLRTERSMQQLLGGLERLIVKNRPAAEEAVNTTPETPEGRERPSAVESPVAEPPVAEQAVFHTRPESSRWKIFG
jgi:uncharacterized coiled-coil protein SlyX